MAGSMGEGREEATFEAAVIDQLAKSGYDTVTRDPNGGQITEIGIIHDELVPAEQKHSPISGEVAAGVSNYGSAFGVALNYDASKPRGALIETRLDLRIRDRATGKPCSRAAPASPPAKAIRAGPMKRSPTAWPQRFSPNSRKCRIAPLQLRHPRL
jgi:hypothetical protein